MKIKAIKTEKVTPYNISIFKLLDKHLTEISECSILAITSKIISICEGRVVRVEDSNKDDLIKQEADLFLDKTENNYGVYITIKNNLLAASAGIDESNTGGYFVLWPENPQKSANEIRAYLKNRFGLKKVGVIITDSKTTPLRWGVIGAGIAFSGFSAINDLIGQPDIFGRKLEMTKVSVLDGLAAAAVVEMGEGAEQTPMAVICDIPFVRFCESDPSESELASLNININDDIYAPLLRGVSWKKGKK